MIGYIIGLLLVDLAVLCALIKSSEVREENDN